MEDFFKWIVAGFAGGVISTMKMYGRGNILKISFPSEIYAIMLPARQFG